MIGHTNKQTNRDYNFIYKQYNDEQKHRQILHRKIIRNLDRLFIETWTERDR